MLEQVVTGSGLYSLAARGSDARTALRLQDSPGELPLAERVLYVGKAEHSLFNRLAETHFASHKTGSSTVRRTFAALLELSPVPRPNRIAYPTRKQLMTMCSNYAVQEDDEIRLTDWMTEQLEIRFFPSPWVPLRDLERAVGAALKPPLDQERPPMWSPNPWYDEVAAARERLRLKVQRQLGLSDRSRPDR